MSLIQVFGGLAIFIFGMNLMSDGLHRVAGERNAIANMLTNGESRITKVVAVMPDGSNGTPCGVCREFMMQLGPESKEIEILLSLEPLKTVKLGEQLPDWWGKKYE